MQCILLKKNFLIIRWDRQTERREHTHHFIWKILFNSNFKKKLKENNKN